MKNKKNEGEMTDNNAFQWFSLLDDKKQLSIERRTKKDPDSSEFYAFILDRYSKEICDYINSKETN